MLAMFMFYTRDDRDMTEDLTKYSAHPHTRINIPKLELVMWKEHNFSIIFFTLNELVSGAAASS